MADIVYHNFSTVIGEKTINFESDTTKVALLTSGYTPDADHVDWSDVSANELADGNGYTAGGVEVSGNVTDDDDNDKSTYDISNPSWTASGGIIGEAPNQARYAVLYDDTTSPKYLIYCFDLVTGRTAQDGADLTITIDSSNGLFYISQV